MAIYNEYGKLKQVILGISPEIRPPFDLPRPMRSGINKLTLLQYLFLGKIFRNRPIPGYVTAWYRRELDILSSTLIENDVKVLPLEAIKPLKEEFPGLIQMFARDPVFIIGNRVIVGNLQMQMRKKEHRGYGAIIKQLEDNGYEIFKMPPNPGLFLEGGDVIVDQPYVYVGINTYASNLEGLRWLQNVLKNEFEVIPVPLCNPAIQHLDCCMTIIGKNRGIIHRESIKNLPDHFKSFDFIEVDSETRKQLGTNVLVIDPKSIIVQKRHHKLIDELNKRGYEVHALNFTMHARTHGAFRCATCPVDRDF
jgi:glycine amidinotransferase